MPLAPGARVGPYEIVAQIGEGGMGRCGGPAIHSSIAMSR